MALLSTVRAWFIRRRRGPLQVCKDEGAYQWHLKELWVQPEHAPAPPKPSDYLTAREHPASSRPTLFRVARSRPLDWNIAFTAAFSKAIARADRSMQGRVLLALAELSSDPITQRGDTVKPLLADKEGRWRYRLCDYRLVYEPHDVTRMVILLDFAPRGGVYE